MTTRARVLSLVIGALLLLTAVPFGVLQFRVAKSRAFCDAVQALPSGELDQFADRCERLLRERGGPEAKLDSIRDTNVLAQFSLIGRRPYEIVVEKHLVGIHFIKGNWRYSTSAFWDEDYLTDGDPIRVLKMTYGTFGWRVLCQRTARRGEPDGPANGSQPIRSETNSTSPAAGSRR